MNKTLFELTELASSSTRIDPALYVKHDVKRGLRDVNGNGVVTGLTEISEIQSFKINEQGEKISCDGELFYRGINIYDLVDGFSSEKRFGFEETVYLLLFGNLPTSEELANFNQLLGEYRTLPPNFTRDIIMKRPSKDIMNVLARSVLTLYSYDDMADDISTSNLLRQGLDLISSFPMLSIYGYQVYRHYYNNDSLFIHNPKPELSTAENILHMLRKDSEYSNTEARILDLCLVLHAEHGGGNNSTFTNHVVSSSGTDTYSAVAASLGSLKGPKHGGANSKVVQMFEDIEQNVDIKNDDAIKDYLARMLNKDAFDKTGLIYGFGHAVYSLSDPRADILHKYTKILVDEKNCHEEYDLYERVARIAPEIIGNKRKIYKGVSSNIDFYSGLVYKMLNIPMELFTPIFAIARIAGWTAHRIEEISNNGKIIRPAYKAVAPRQKYVDLKNR